MPLEPLGTSSIIEAATRSPASESTFLPSRSCASTSSCSRSTPTAWPICSSTSRPKASLRSAPLPSPCLHCPCLHCPCLHCPCLHCLCPCLCTPIPVHYLPPIPHPLMRPCAPSLPVPVVGPQPFVAFALAEHMRVNAPPARDIICSSSEARLRPFAFAPCPHLHHLAHLAHARLPRQPCPSHAPTSRPRPLPHTYCRCMYSTLNVSTHAPPRERSLPPTHSYQSRRSLLRRSTRCVPVGGTRTLRETAGATLTSTANHLLLTTYY